MNWQTVKSSASSLYVYLAWAIFFAVLIWLLGPNIIERRTEHVGWYFAHILGGTLVLTLGPLQFIGAIRNRYRRFHRICGYLVILGSALAIAALVRLLSLPGCDACLPSQLTAIFLWIVCIAVALWAILHHHILLHQHNMARSFVFACYFLSVRLLDRFGLDRLLPFVKSEDGRFANSDWMAWIIPLVIVEAYFGYKWTIALSQRSVRRKRPGNTY